MAVKTKNIVVGGKVFTESGHKSPQDHVAKKTLRREERDFDEEVVTRTTSSFIIKSSSKFHRDMIEE